MLHMESSPHESSIHTRRILHDNHEVHPAEPAMDTMRVMHLGETPTKEISRKRKLSTSQILAHQRRISVPVAPQAPLLAVQQPKTLTWGDRILALIMTVGFILPVIGYALYALVGVLGVGALVTMAFATGVTIVLLLGLFPLVPVLAGTTLLAVSCLGMLLFVNAMGSAIHALLHLLSSGRKMIGL